MKEKPEINEEIKKLVMARIDAKMLPNIKISIGSSGSPSKEEMIEHLKKADKEGRQMVKQLQVEILC